MLVPNIGTRRWWLPAMACLSLLMATWPVRADDARARLARMKAAAVERNYRGTMVFTSGGTVSSSRVVHYSVGADSFEHIEALDGRMQQVLRHNDVVHTFWPSSGVVVVERRDTPQGAASLLQTVDARLLDQYELRIEGRQRVAERDAEVFLLTPKDELRYAQRLWSDVHSGLMLRAEVIGPGRVILESSGFTTIDINVKPLPDAILQPLKRLTQYRQLRAQQERTQLDSEGWVMTRQLAGFIPGSVVRRPLEAQSDGDGKPPDKMVQAVFSDGLTHVSLFIERFDERRHRKEVQALIGATATLMKRRGDHWLTAMGDVPPATLKLLIDSLERRP